MSTIKNWLLGSVVVLGVWQGGSCLEGSKNCALPNQRFTTNQDLLLDDQSVNQFANVQEDKHPSKYSSGQTHTQPSDKNLAQSTPSSPSGASSDLKDYTGNYQFDQNNQLVSYQAGHTSNSQSASSSTGSTGQIDINHANTQELMNIKGIGEKKAQAIIDYRNTHGGFKTVEELNEVKGIGDATLAKNKDVLTISPL